MDKPYTGFIVVRLRKDLDPQRDVDVEDLVALARKHGVADLAALLEASPQCRTGRLVSAIPIERGLELEAKAAERRGAPLPRRLSSYWRIDARAIEDDSDAERLVAALRRLHAIEAAYREVRGRNPESPALSPDPFANHQFHLLPAPVGVDALFAHSCPNGDGRSAGFIDLEQGWIREHEDLPRFADLPNISYEMQQESLHHGTAVLGVAVGKKNGRGIIGIAPRAARVNVTSHIHGGRPDQVENAIRAVVHNVEIGNLHPGDVLLIEWQDFFARPAETHPALRDAIQEACGIGLVVVEAAGNANTDLDTVDELNPTHEAFEDSEAIIVAACHSALAPDRASHTRWLHPIFPSGSNFGSRVDCHAAGEDVVTAGPSRFLSQMIGNGADEKTQYRRDFGGTSAAAAIVAGVAVAVQSMVIGAGRQPLSSSEMRGLLRTEGTPHGPPLDEHIGVMPDLKKIVTRLRLPMT